MTRRHWMTFAAVFAAAWLGFFVGQERTAPPLPRVPLIGIASVNDANYVRAVRQAGGIPVILPDHDADPAIIAGYLTRLDGLLMPGGLDIPPGEYGEEPHPTVEVLADERYLFEKLLGREWIQGTGKPLLGICLGSQWIGVLHGGTLVQDIPSEIGGSHRGTTHRITIVPGTRLHRIFGETEFEVNSSHHQAVDIPGERLDTLRVAARSPDGVVEAIETTHADRFLIGVQWHPERMPDDPRQARLLRAFIDAAARSGP